jgi:hypothetical protein
MGYVLSRIQGTFLSLSSQNSDIERRAMIVCSCDFASSASGSPRFSASRQDGVLNIFNILPYRA